MIGVGPEINSAAKAVGLFGPDGSLSPSWFENPLAALETILTDANQRQAVLDLLDQLFEPQTPAGVPANEKWHPLLGEQSQGNLYLTVANGAGPVTIGIAGEVHSTSGTLPASLRAHLPIVTVSDSGVTAVAGTSNGAFAMDVRLELNWSKATGEAIALHAIRATGKLTPFDSPPASLAIVLEGLSLDGSAPRDTVLDPAHLDGTSLQLVIGLLREKLRQIATTATGEAAALANHLMPLLGLADGFPAFPFTTLTTDASALKNWLSALVSSSKMAEWVGHVGGIIGGAVGATGTGTQADPWRVRILQIDPNSELDVAVAQVTAEHSGTTSLEFAVSGSYLSAGPNPAAAVRAVATIASIPLKGVAAAKVLPAASVAVLAPGNGADQLVNAANIAVRSAEAGALWNGATIVPVLELHDVTLTVAGQTTHYDRLDLTNTGSVVAAASNAAKALLLDAIGTTGVGQHLAALAGLTAPSGDPSSPHTVDLAALVSHPTQAIAAVHRAALLDSTHNWSFLFAELTAVSGLTGTVSGAGTNNDPWRVSLAPGTISIELAAWNSQESHNASDVQQLRVGLRASVTSAPWNAWWLAELLAVDLPQSGAGAIALMAGQHAAFSLQPVPALPPSAGVTLSADSVAITMDWAPGGSMQLRGAVSNLSATSGTTVNVPSLVFPAPAGFDISNPLPALGVSLADLEALFLRLFSRGLSSWAGAQGAALSVLLGLNGNLPGLQADWPTLQGNIFTDPFGSLRAWLNHLAVDISSDASPFLPAGLSWLAAFMSGASTGSADGPPADPLAGSGIYDDPWLLPVLPDIDLLAWLEPAGPPPNWISGLSAAIGAATSFQELLAVVNDYAGLLPAVSEALGYQDPADLAKGLDALASWLNATDGFVPGDSQVPTGGTWTAGTTIHSAHFQQPSDPAAISQINNQIAAWNTGPKVVLLLGPAFSDHSIWNDLLASTALKPNFNLRASGVDPGSIDLRGVTDAADFYTADLQENGPDGVVAQIAQVVARIGELRPGIPVTIVAHSTAGLAARAFAAANPSLVRGLITLGSPHLGSPQDPLTDFATGNALRAVKEFTPALPAGPLQDAVDALIVAMDGFLPAAAPGLLPVANSFPAAAFTVPASTDTGGVPALAIGGTLADDLLIQMKQALATLANSAAASTIPAPTHLSFGARARLDFGANGDIHADVRVRGDASRVALRPGVAEPARPPHAFTVQIALYENDGWLVGSPAEDIRVRWAELGLTANSAGVTPQLRLHGAAFKSPTLGLVDLSHPQAQVLLGKVLQGISAAGATAGVAVSAVLAGLTSLGIATPDIHGGIGISADAWTALTADPSGFLAPRLKSALASGLAGFAGASDGSYAVSIGSSPVQLYVQNGTVGIRTTTALQLGEAGSASVDARISVSDFHPALDLSVSLGAATLTYAQSGHLSLSAPPWIDSLSLLPAPSASDLSAALNRAIPRVLLSGAMSAVLESVLGPGLRVPPLDRLFENPGKVLVAADALGNGTSLDGSRISLLLTAIANAAGLPTGPGLALPGNLQLTASGADPVQLQLSTTSPLGGIVDLQVSSEIDKSLHVKPAGTIALHLNLPGTWGAATITFGASDSGVSLVVAPEVPAPNPPVPPIQLLPTFGGLGALMGAADALLPAALNELVDALGPSTLRDNALAVAQAFDLYDAAGKFSAHAAQWRALTQGDWASTVSAAMQTTVIPALSSVLSSIVGPVSTAGNAVRIGAGGPFSASIGWDTGPTVSVHVAGLKAADGAISADADLGFAAGKIVVNISLGVHLQSSVGVAIVPAISVGINGGSFTLKLLPLGADKAAVLAISILPTPSVQASADMAVALAEDWLLPVVTDLMVGAAKPVFATTVWAGGPTVQALLQGAGLITASGDLAPSLPSIDTLIQNLLASFAAQAQLSIDKFKLQFVDDSFGLGVNLRGSHDISLGSVGLSLRLENADLTTAAPGVTVYVFQKKTGGLAFSPKLSVAGLGAEFTGPGGAPLVKNDSFRLESAGGYLFFEFDGSLTNLGGAVDAKGLGLPLGLLGGAHDGGNPVASSLLQGSGSTGGDPNPVNPGVDVLVSYINGSFAIQIGAPNPPLWIGVHRSFGPIYIEQIGLEWTNDAAALLVDGSVKVAALTIQAYELSLNINFKQLLAPEHWTLDLQGLAVGFDSGPVSISGGLIKNPGPPVEYDGMLSAVIAGRGFTVVGGYARPTDSQGNFTSLFIFVSLPIPLGGPPFLFVTGLGGGAGYNRELIPPTDITQIPNFFLISAIDDASLSNNPMGALVSMGKAMPPLRGGYWLAAGVRFNSFVVVNTIAVVYVALDRGFEIGILGVSHMQLPAPGIELVSIELALKVRYSSAEGLFSIQGQLTDNSWLFSRDCQLTGGFAFFIWFSQGHFVLTIGGYHPSFQKPPEFPDVPRLGFHWQALDFVQIKGESYFAVTSSAFMCGGRLEASAGFDGIRAWFTVHLDILIQWDPFHYDFLGGIQVGVSLRIEVCFWGVCAGVSITISRGADIHIFGPAFHADLTFDAYITTITLSFGGDPHPQPDPLPWASFRDKYLVSGNPENTWVGARVLSGVLVPDPPGAQPSPGTLADPWKLNPEFAFLTESRMPVSGYSVLTTGTDAQGAQIQIPMKGKSDAPVFDLAPMQKLKVGSVHHINFTPALTHPAQFLVEEIFDLLPEATWRWYDPTHLPAAANRINAITGLRITGFAVLQGKSALIPISTLVDDDPRLALPLPFATVISVVGVLRTFGLTAETIATITAAASSAQVTSAASRMLTGNGFFSAARQTAGLPVAGISPLADFALTSRRSAPPLLTPLTTGLSMDPVGLPAPQTFFRPAAIEAVLLNGPRLRAVLQSRPLATTDAPPSLHTSVSKVAAAANAPRMAAPRVQVAAGARLHRVPAPNGPSATRLSTSPRTMRNLELSALAGVTHAANFDLAANNLMGDGLVVPAGTTHLWDAPGTFPLELTGNAIVRITYMNRAGNIIHDSELVVNERALLNGPPDCEMVAIACLGSWTSKELQISPGFGAVSSVVAAPGAVAAVGWQSGNLLPQVTPTSLLARGASLILRKPYTGLFNGQKVAQAMTKVSAALAAQSGLETWLPKSIGVVMIILDQRDANAAGAGDLDIACQGATLTVPPVVGAGGRRRALLYDVAARDDKAEHITVAVGSQSGWALAGVVGLWGSAAEWAARLHGSVPPQLVPDGPLTPGGEVRVRLTNPARGAQ